MNDSTTIHILLAEDSPTQAVHIGFSLEEAGYKVTIAENGKVALGILKQSAPDLIVSDIVMPELDGFELCQAVKSDASLSSIPVILLTSLSDTRDIVKGLVAGADSFIRKADNEKHLLVRISDLLEESGKQQGRGQEVELSFDFNLQPYSFNTHFQQVFNLMISIYEQAIDINSDLELVNRELGQARDDAEAANRAKSTFLASMSHELRTPMNAIIGYSELLLDDLGDEEQTRSDLKRILSAGQHLLSLINNVLDLAKVEAGRMDIFPEEISPKELLEGVATMMIPVAAENNNRISVTCSDVIPQMFTDRTKLVQILTNLLSNASKFTSDGEIKVNVDFQQTDAGKHAIFAVSDTGIGMTEDQLASVFDEFSQAEASTTRDYGGTGLGLSISKKMAELLHGTLDADSTEGLGSTFTLKLPVAFVESESSISEGQSDADREIRSVLVIDGDVEVRSGLREPLETVGWRVITARDGEEGFEKARSESPTVILTDILLPGIDTWALLERLKRHSETAKIPVILCSALGGALGSFAMGSVDSLVKPVDRKIIVDTLSRFKKDATGDLLIVDDDADTRDLFRRAAQSDGWRTREAENGQVCLDLITERIPGAILLDLYMPELDGFGVIEALEANPDWRGIPIIVVSVDEFTRGTQQWMNDRLQQVFSGPASGRNELLDNLIALVDRSAGHRAASQ